MNRTAETIKVRLTSARVSHAPAREGSSVSFLVANQIGEEIDVERAEGQRMIERGLAVPVTVTSGKNNESTKRAGRETR